MDLAAARNFGLDSRLLIRNILLRTARAVVPVILAIDPVDWFRMRAASIRSLSAWLSSSALPVKMASFLGNLVAWQIFSRKDSVTLKLHSDGRKYLNCGGDPRHDPYLDTQPMPKYDLDDF